MIDLIVLAEVAAIAVMVALAVYEWSMHHE